MAVTSIAPVRSSGLPFYRPYRVERYRSVDLAPLMRTVGVVVEELYPQGAKKLVSRLDETLWGYADAHVMRTPKGTPIALAAEVSKGLRRVKLSTFWIHPLYRGRGLGRALLRHRMEDWQRGGVTSIFVTVREQHASELERLFIPQGFVRVATVPHLYGEGKSEVILDLDVLDSPNVASLQGRKPPFKSQAA